MPKLFRVTTTFQMLVLAETPEEAKEISKANENDADCERDQATRSAEVVCTQQELDPEERDSIPWGSNDNQTATQLLPNGFPF